MGDFAGYHSSLCGQHYGPDAVTHTCPADGGNLDAIPDMAPCHRSTSPADISASPETSIWRYLPLLPVSDPGHFGRPLTAVGWTPSVRGERLAEQLGLRSLRLEDHGRNPTASVKNRASAVTVPRAQQVSPETIVTASTGNARAGLVEMAAEGGTSPDPWALEMAHNEGVGRPRHTEMVAGPQHNHESEGPETMKGSGGRGRTNDPDTTKADAGRSRRRLLVTVLLLTLAGFLGRGAFLLVAGPDRPLVGDEPGYHGIAAAFLAGEGWHDGPFRATRPPLTSWLLTLVYLVTGPSAAAGRWSMVVISALVAPIVFLIGRAYFGQASCAPLWAAIAWLVYPPSVFYAASLVTENLAALLSVAGVGGYLWAATSRSRWAAVLTGILWAGAALNRPATLAFPLFLIGIHAVLARKVRWRWSGAQWAVALAAFGIGLAPWTIRNFRLLGALIPVTSYGGIMFSSSNATLGHPTVQAGGYYHAPGIRGYLQSLPESAWGPEGLRMGLEKIGEQPGLFLQAVFHRAVNFWTPRPDPYDSAWTSNDWLMSLIWIPTLLFSLLSFVRAPGHLDWPSLALIGYTFLVTLPFWGTPRFRFPVDSLILLRAVVGVEAGVGAVLARRRRPYGAALAR